MFEQAMRGATRWREVSQRTTESRLEELEKMLRSDRRRRQRRRQRRRRQKRGGRRDGFSLATSVGLAREAGRQRRRPFSLRRRPVAAIASAADRPKCRRAVAVERANEGRDDDDGQPDEGAPSPERDEPVCCWRRGVGVLPFCGRFSC